jgi:hypothetical protein
MKLTVSLGERTGTLCCPGRLFVHVRSHSLVCRDQLWCARRLRATRRLAYFDGCRACTGRVIHEFDPWFNYRATEYMAANGWHKFQVPPCCRQLSLPRPLSRPVPTQRVGCPCVRRGTTTRCGIRSDGTWVRPPTPVYSSRHGACIPSLCAVAFPPPPSFRMLAHTLARILSTLTPLAMQDQHMLPISLHDVCVFLPAGFGAIATIFTGYCRRGPLRSCASLVDRCCSPRCPQAARVGVHRFGRRRRCDDVLHVDTYAHVATRVRVRAMPFACRLVHRRSVGSARASDAICGWRL